MNVENTSGHGEFAIIPDEIKGWNWGAFWLSWIWGIFNGSYIALLALLPIANLIIPFYLGAKGNELAWKNRHWIDIESFKESQRIWRNWGWAIAIAIIVAVGIRCHYLYKKEQITAEITAQVLDIISKDDKASKIIGNDYKIHFEPALETVTSSNGEFPIGHIMFIKGASGAVSVYTSLDENGNILAITISPPANAEKLTISVGSGK